MIFDSLYISTVVHAISS